MKFAKYLEAESVPEWRAAYVNYKIMKKAVKKVSAAVKRNTTPPKLTRTNEIATSPLLLPSPSLSPTGSHANLPYAESSGTSFPSENGLAHPSPPKSGGKGRPGSPTKHREKRAIMKTTASRISLFLESRAVGSPRASPVLHIDLDLSLTDILADRSPEEQQFFVKLDEELAKVTNFFKEREAEAVKRYNDLVFQIHMLDKKKREEGLRNDATASWTHLPQDAWDLVKTGVQNIKDTTQEVFVSKNLKEPATIVVSPSRANSDEALTGPANHQTPFVHHIKGKVNTKLVRARIKRAVLDYYNSLEMLKNYRILNVTAFSKILKKFDKAANWAATRKYMAKVKSAPFSTSSKVDDLIESVERLFSRSFEDGHRRQAMQKLRIPDHKKTTHHFVSWRTGLYVGLSIPALLYALVIVGKDDGKTLPNMAIFTSIYAGFSLPIIFLLLFGCNIHVWNASRINYRFIFEFEPRDNLDVHQFLEFPSLLLLFWSYTIVCNLNYQWFEPHISPTAFPMIFFVISLVMLFLPVPFFYYTSRRWIIYSITRIFFSYYNPVEFRDFFITDELNSLVYFFVSLQTFFCTYSNDWVNVDQTCTVIFSWVTPFVSMLPAWWRLLQCLRRYRDTKQFFPHLVNAGKYTTSMTVVLFSAGSTLTGIPAVRAMWILFSIFATAYTYAWDILMDWGLGNRRSKHIFLRNELVYSSPKIYYFAIISNLFLRVSWVHNIAPNSWREVIDSRLLVYIIAVLEVLRRFQWNFFRLENEHLNNCGQFRAIKDIPLPFAEGNRGDDHDPDTGKHMPTARIPTEQERDEEEEKLQELDRKFINRREYEGSSSKKMKRREEEAEEEEEEEDAMSDGDFNAIPESIE